MKDINNLITKLRTTLQPWRSFLIVIDGRDGVGKSSLGRHLAWELHVPLVETDLFLAEASDNTPVYRFDDLKRVLESRLKHDRPIMIEGIFIRQLLQQIGIKPDFVIYLKNSNCDGSITWESSFIKYDSEFPPNTADHVLFK